MRKRQSSGPGALPGLTRWLVQLGAPAQWREPLIGDLEEIYMSDLDSGYSAGAASRRATLEALRSIFNRPHTPKPPGRRPKKKRGDAWMKSFLYDLRFASRALRRAPLFTLVVTATLALGIGCVTAFGGLFDSVLLRPLPFAEPDRLVQIWGENTERPGGRYNSSHLDYLDIRAGTKTFAELAIYHHTFSNFIHEGTPPERLPSLFISPNFFRTLGLEPILGRAFTTQDDSEQAPPTVILGADYWRQRFGGDRSILGQTVRIDDTLRTVIGVGPEGLYFPKAADAFVPITSLSGITIRGVHSQQVIGRLADGYSQDQAQAEVSQIAAHLREAYPGSNALRDLRVDPLHESVVGRTRGQLQMVSVAAAFLLLVVCANISSLLLERSTRRQREVATRAALGASHGQLMRSFLAESLILVSLGAAGAVAIAVLVRRLLLAYGPPLPRHVEPHLDARALLITGGVTAAISILFALIPGLHTLGRNLYSRLRVGLVGVDGQSGRRWRAIFVTVQISLAVVLTLSAALLVQSLENIYSVDLGYDSQGILAVDLEVPTSFVSSEWPATVDFYQGLIEKLRSTPGVAAVAAAHHHAANPGWGTSFTIKGEEPPPVGQEPEASFRPITADYFTTLSIPLLAGRFYEDTLRSEPPGQVIVNRSFLETHLGGVAPAAALGRTIVRDCWWNQEITEYEIIGVVADTRFAGRHRAPWPALYLPHRLDATPMMTVLVRAGEGLDPLSLMPAVRQSVGELNPQMAVGRAATLEELLGETVSRRRFLTFLLTAFAAVTLSLAALGLYGALAFATARRTRELGLRIALGARSNQVQGLVLKDAVRLTIFGLFFGLTASFFTSRALDALLFGIQGADPMTFAGVAALLGLMAMVAGWLPAWRAAHIDPCRALADE